MERSMTNPFKPFSPAAAPARTISPGKLAMPLEGA